MRQYDKVIFVCGDNTALSPIAAALFRKITFDMYVVISRGVVVLFSEPYNPKVYDILKEKGITLTPTNSKAISNKDFAKNTLVLTMENSEKMHLYKYFYNAQNVYTIKEFTGGDGDVTEPLGKGIEAYSKVSDELEILLEKVKDNMLKEDF